MRRNTLAIFVVLLVTTLLVGCIYWFVWRISDAEYANAERHTAGLLKNTGVIVDAFDTDNPPYFDTEQELQEFLGAVESYPGELEQLANTVVVKNDPAVRTEFETAKNSFTAYGEAAKDTAQSVETYYMLAKNCGFIRIYTPTSFSSSQRANCQKAFTGIDSLPKSNFKSDFLVKYAAGIQEMMVTLAATPTPNEAALNKLRGDIDSLFTTTSINYGLPEAPTKQLQQLTQTLSIQKAKLIR
jgi:hypothetical protein